MEEIKFSQKQQQQSPSQTDSKLTQSKSEPQSGFKAENFLRAVPARAGISKFIPIIIIIVVVAAGIFSGLVFSSRNKNAKSQARAAVDEEQLTGEQKQSFAQTFRDEAEGTIEKNDFKEYAQGTHKLIRPGGESQTAYLTSSVLDLDQYVGKKVKVYGETFGSSQVGWFMDVGKVEVVQ